MDLVFVLLSESTNVPIPVKKLAEKLNNSESYLQQVSKPLLKPSLIKSSLGPSGGYCLAKPTYTINSTEIVRAMDPSIE